MWNNTGGFEQQGGAQAGGYLNSPGFGSSQPSQEKRAKQRAQNVIPCTTAQIHRAEQADDSYVIDNITLHQVTLVGLVRTVSEQATRLDYQIDDMTGTPLEVRQFVDSDENTPEEEKMIPMRENTYVRIFGNIRSFQNQRSVVAFKMTPVTDMNELTMHLLEVVHSHLALTKAASSSTGQAQAGYTPTGGATGMSVGSYAGAQGDGLTNLSPAQKQVETVIRSCRDDQGISIHQISSQLRGIPQSAIREAVEYLSSEGHIYSTIDDEHYKSTESGD